MPNTQLWTLDAAEEATPWFDTRGIEKVEVQGLLSGSLTVLSEYSNDPTYAAKGGVVTADSKTASFILSLSAPLPRFVRLRVSAWTSGSAIISLGTGIDARGLMAEVRPESQAPTQATS